MANTPQRIGNYNIDRRIGKGGQSEVWLGRHRSLENRLVAIKLLMSQEQEWVSRFGREAAITSNLRHENIVQIFDHGYQAPFHYTVMEYVEDGALRDLLKARRKLPLDQALQIYRRAGAALDHAHAHGIIHRDVSPGNILVEQHSGRVLLADFGIARESGKSGDTTVNKVMGTPGYLSPEHAQSATAVTQLSDLYALGIVLFEMLSGELPWNHNPGMPPDASGGPFVPLKTLRDAGLEGLPSDVDRVIQTILALDPAKRYPTAAAATQDLDRVLSRHTSPTQIVGGKATLDAGPSVLAPPPEPHPVETVLGLDLLKGPMQRAQQRADQLRDPAEIATILNAWSTRGRLRRQMLGRQAALHRVSSANMYFYTLDVLYETREPAQTIVEPDRAAAVLPNEKQLDRWGVELPAPKEFADAPGGTVRLPGSTRVIKCDACAGIGRIECVQCKGSGRVSDLSDAPAGLKPARVGAPDAAHAGGASAAISAAAAKPGAASVAPRLVPCAACAGSGRLPCKQCAGEGRLLERKQTAWSRHAAVYAGHEALPVSHDWLRQMCAPLEVYRERQIGNLRPAWQHIPALNDLLLQAHASADNNTKIVLSEVTISLIPITEVLFDLDDTSATPGQSNPDDELYSWYICGFENQLQDDWRFLNWARVGVLVLAPVAFLLFVLVLLLVIMWR